MGERTIATLTADSSYTKYSAQFDEHYHSVQDGALTETLHKHIFPAFAHHDAKEELVILDICYGLGFNTLASIANAKDKKLTIYSPEFDVELMRSLRDFVYPAEFAHLRAIIESISRAFEYHDERLDIYVMIGDARKEILKISESVDIVYQDAFSPKKNPLLWTSEYFADIANLMSDEAIMTTYSIATPPRLAMAENGLFIYEYQNEHTRKSTLATKKSSKNYNEVDMVSKQKANPTAKAMRDSDFIV